MSIFPRITQKRAVEIINILGMTFGYGDARLKHREGISEVLFISFHGKYTGYCIELTDETREDIEYFFSHAKEHAYAELHLPIYNQSDRKTIKFKVRNQVGGDRRTFAVAQLDYRKYHEFSDEEVALADNYFRKYVYKKPYMEEIQKEAVVS